MTRPRSFVPTLADHRSLGVDDYASDPWVGMGMDVFPGQIDGSEHVAVVDHRLSL
jgi:hypothetical protein